MIMPSVFSRIPSAVAVVLQSHLGLQEAPAINDETPLPESMREAVRVFATRSARLSTTTGATDWSTQITLRFAARKTSTKSAALAADALLCMASDALLGRPLEAWEPLRGLGLMGVDERVPVQIMPLRDRTTDTEVAEVDLSFAIRHRTSGSTLQPIPG